MSSPTDPSSSGSRPGHAPRRVRRYSSGGTESSSASITAAPIVDLTGDSPEHSIPPMIEEDLQEIHPTQQTLAEFLDDHSSPTEAQTRNSNGRKRGYAMPQPKEPHPGPPAFPNTQPEPAARLRTRTWDFWPSHANNHLPLFQDPTANSRAYNPALQRERSFSDWSIPKWQPDSEVSNCPICGAAFSFWYRKHHCRKCGRVVCASCSPHRITIPRQFIVRPPPDFRGLASPPVSSNRSPENLIDLGDGDDEEASSARRPSGSSRANQLNDLANPALGGGEEVRLCNPCVPDPNPDPPRQYNLLDSQTLPAPSSTARGAYRHMFPPSVRNPGLYEALPQFHRPYTPSETRSFFGPEATRNIRHGLRNSNQPFAPEAYPVPALAGMQGERPQPPASVGHSVAPPVVPAPAGTYGSSQNTVVQIPNLPMYYPFSTPDYSNRPMAARSAPLHHQTHFHQPRSRHRVDFNRPLPVPPAPVQRRPTSESDSCPICSHIFRPCNQGGSEAQREAHIRECIQIFQTRATTSGRSPSPPAGCDQMIHFKATEKDCVGQDGAPQECTICMEEYEVGVELSRLVCFCKFHKSCITGWFKRKAECPVHKVSI
ncbi:hypothetical protein LOZ66_003999 [Ophidiomyces ophidiicola]|nr:hypothetical protein LOZ66_003999 [Ophidiomyces ophidiicola]